MMEAPRPGGAGTEVMPGPVLPVTIALLLTSTAVYFAGTAAAPALAARWGLEGAGSAALTWGVQAGFVVGTLTVVGLDLADRLRPGILVGALLSSAAIASLLLPLAPTVEAGVALRFAAGALAGPIYPVGMRYLATWTAQLGPRLGILLAAYTAGAGAAFLVQSTGAAWQTSLTVTSLAALLAAALAPVLLKPGPLLPRRARLDLAALRRALSAPAYRWSSAAYYGHMWELFAFWGLVPFFLAGAGWSAGGALVLVTGVFLTGALGCLVAGRLSSRWGEARVARFALSASAAACLASPWLFAAPRAVQALAVLLWGAVVVADSPMFSALSARAAPPAYVGSALTFQNGLGFALTIVSLALVGAIADATGTWRYALLVLAPGPLLALWPTRRLVDWQRQGEPRAAKRG